MEASTVNMKIRLLLAYAGDVDARAAGVAIATERARLDAVSLTPLLYPYWHQANTSTDRLSAADLSLIGQHL